MPYLKTSELPDNVRELPSPAQLIWMHAFNSAFEQYGTDEKAFAIAWVAVAAAGYKKTDGEWQLTEDATLQSELRKQTQFAKVKSLRVLEFGESLVVNADSIIWSAETLGDGKGNHVFGQWKVLENYKPEAKSPSLVREWNVITPAVSTETLKDGEHVVVLVESGYNSDKERIYQPEAVLASAPMYEGMPMYLDHAGTERKPEAVRSIKDMVARILKTWTEWTDKGVARVLAKIHVWDEWLNNRLKDEHFKAMVGLSHNAHAISGHRRENGKLVRIIESITNVHSVDFVSKAAFGGRVLESDPIND